jgi:hypothetical protein
VQGQHDPGTDAASLSSLREHWVDCDWYCWD